MTAPMRIRRAALRDFCESALVRAGASPAHAAITAEALTEADAFGVFTHGNKLLHGYLRRLKAGSFRSNIEPVVRREGPGWAVVDGNSVLGQVSGRFAMEVAIRKARQCGIAYVSTDYSNHFGAAGHYALQAARAGLIGIAVCNDIPSVTAPGSRSPVTGTNPIAYALPAGERDPIFFDAAISTVAGGKVYAASARGQAIPGDWLIDSRGMPTSDASLYPEHAALAPMSGHKGYGLALLIESLSAFVSGAAMTHRVGSWMFGDLSTPTRHGAGFIAIDAQAMAPDGEFVRRVHELIDEIHATPTAPGVERVLLPGEREWMTARGADDDGILLPADVAEKLSDAARESGIALPGTGN